MIWFYGNFLVPMIIHKFLKYSCEAAANNVWDERIPECLFWSLFYHLTLTHFWFNGGMVTVEKKQFCGKWFTIKKQMITAGLNINTTKLKCMRNKTFWVINFIWPLKSLQFNVLTLYMTMKIFGCFKWKREGKM